MLGGFLLLNKEDSNKIYYHSSPIKFRLEKSLVKSIMQMATKLDIQNWIIDSLKRNNGSAYLVQVTKDI